MPTAPEDVLSSAMAAALLLEPGERALVLGGPGVIEELTARGVVTVRPGAGGEIGTVDAVVVGMDPSFNYSSLAAAATALHAGARLIGTNDDATFPAPHGVLPGAGSLLAAVARAGQAEPIVAGKPHPPTVSLVRERVGEVETVVGDRPSTDGLLARRLEARFGLVLTGVTPPGHGPRRPGTRFRGGRPSRPGPRQSSAERPGQTANWSKHPAGDAVLAAASRPGRTYAVNMATKPLEKYVAAGKEFSETTRKRVQTIASDLAREGETGREHAEDWADDFVERGRRTR